MTDELMSELDKIRIKEFVKDVAKRRPSIFIKT